ncbi:MAG: S41 family peptidase [Planctomycetes bacterium]|nr:S41 family peptidase [Planctomycetota bacterium]
MRARVLWPAALLGLVVVLGIHLAGQDDDPRELHEYYEYYDYFEELARVVVEIEANYVEEVDQKRLFEGSIKGMLRELDPYSAYIPKEMYSIFRQDTQGFFGGLGIHIGIRDEQLTVIAPLEGTPAARAGILPGDKIVRIEGESTEGMTLLEAVNVLRGEPGSQVTISIRHVGSEEEIDVTITREIIEIHSVRGYRRLANGEGWDYWVNPEEKIGYIRLSAFQENTVAELDGAMSTLVAEGVRGLVLDLRSNAGGLLGSAVAVADRFIPEGVVVSIRGRVEGTKEERAHADDDYPAEMLLAVLVNRYSASGSEIVAGALQDYSRATLIGEETFGKGSVQKVIPLRDNASAIKLTTAKYYTPSGRSFHRDPRTKKGGLVPDITVVFTTEQLVQLHRRWQMLAVEAEEPESTDEEEEVKPFVDTQLQRATDLLIGLHVVRSAID